jgi:hypothetical protein
VPTPPDPVDPRVMGGAAWDALCEALRASGRRVTGPDAPAAPADRAEGLRYLLRFLEAGIRLCVEYAEPDHPELCRMIERGMTWGLDCPDCLYLYAPVRGGARYRLFGTRGTANHFDVQVNYGHFASGDIASWGTLDSKSGRELELGPDGALELWLGPEPRPGNWLRTAENAEFLLIRQYFDDWERERPADLWIERVGAPASAPRPRTDQVAARLDRLVTWLEKGGALWETMSRALLALPPNTLNVVKLPDEDVRGGLKGQAYGMGNFRCASDEAVIVEVAPPRCVHWSASLASFWWESIDYATRQASLNGHQAGLDADGRFRGVIAHADPGVPNWLDAAGHEAGTIALRFLLAESAPEVRMRAVPLAELLSHLPPDTPRVGAEARAEALRRRHRAVIARYRR